MYRTLKKFTSGQSVLLEDSHTGLWTGHMRKRRGRWWFTADVGRFSVRHSSLASSGSRIVIPTP